MVKIKVFNDSNELFCHRCNSDDYIIYDLGHTDKGTAFNFGYCDKCKGVIWEECHDE